MVSSLNDNFKLSLTYDSKEHLVLSPVLVGMETLDAKQGSHGFPFHPLLSI